MKYNNEDYSRISNIVLPGYTTKDLIKKAKEIGYNPIKIGKHGYCLPIKQRDFLMEVCGGKAKRRAQVLNEFKKEMRCITPKQKEKFIKILEGYYDQWSLIAIGCETNASLDLVGAICDTIVDLIKMVEKAKVYNPK